MTMKNQHKLNRRTLLKGILGASTVTVGLPMLDFFLNSNGNALADGTSFPCRAGWWFWGNGVIPERWFPTTSGSSYVLNEEMRGRVPGEGFEARGVHSDITVVSGTRVIADGLQAHLDGPTGMFAGRVLGRGESTFVTPSFDSVLRDAPFASQTAFRSIDTGTLTYGTTYSQNGMDSLNTPILDPLELYAALFGSPMTGGDTGATEIGWRLEQSALSVVMEDIQRVQRLVGRRDSQRLDQHFQHIRDLERRLQNRIDAPATPLACPANVAAPGDIDFSREDYFSAQRRHRAHADLMALAFACDRTRVFTHMWSESVDGTRYFASDPDGHHNMSHEGGQQDYVHAITVAIMDEFAYFVQKMKEIPEGDGTLLDNMIILGTTDTSRGQFHNFDNYPILLAGSGGGRFRTGVHVVADGQNTGKVPLTIMRAMGLPLTHWGSDAMRVTDNLSGIEV